MIGQEFKMFYYTKKFENSSQDLYIYPDSNIKIEDPFYDEVIFPVDIKSTLSYPNYIKY